MSAVISGNGLVEVVGTAILPWLVCLLSFVGLARHETVQPRGQNPVSHNRLNRREPYPQFPPGMAGDCDNSRGCQFRLKNRRQRLCLPFHVASTPVELRRVEG